MPKTTLAGHPLHPMLILVPGGLLPFSLILDGLHAATGDASYADAAYYTMLGGYVGGLAAALAGGGDYLTIPSGSETKKTANIHAALNLSVLGLYSINLLLRRGKEGRSGKLPVALNALGNAVLMTSAWYGGEMVYKQGMRVEGVSEVAPAPEVKLPGDEKIAGAFETVQEKAPVEA